MYIPLPALLLWSLGALSLVTYSHGLRSRPRDRDRPIKDWDEFRSRRPQRKQRRGEKPNIILVLTDDQDSELGSMNFMPKTLKYLQDEGTTFSSAFVTTPMCCPSRSSLLTGMYVHNHNVYTNNENCSSVQWQQTHETRNFGTYLSNAGYRTGYFGKYLNQYEGTYVPPGWSEWVGLIRNTRFYNYTLNFNGKRIKHYDNYYKDYLTDLIANDSVTFLKQSKEYFPNRPVAMVLSMPAPHGPEDAAPQYQHLFENVTTHRTPSWNFAPNPDKQWILQYTGKMEPIHTAFTDMLQRKRLQTLQSVDDAVEKVVLELHKLGQLDNTYIIFTSDHGYHLGQYGLLKGKAMPYEFDVRVPFLMRGPKIPHGIRVPNIVINIDIAPTLLDIAGIPVPEHMDGRSIMRLFEGSTERGSIIGGQMKRKKAWRDTFMIERGKITHKKLIERERMEARKNNLVSTKEQRLAGECSKAEYQPPCKATQQWECKADEEGRYRMYKCRHRMKQNDAVALDEPVVHPPPGQCICPDGRLGIDRREKRLQRRFLKDHVNQPEMLKPRFMRSRRQLVQEEKAADASSIENLDDGPPDSAIVRKHEEGSITQPEGSFLGKKSSFLRPRHVGPPPAGPKRRRTRRRQRQELRALERDLQVNAHKSRRRIRRQASSNSLPVNCRVLANQSVSCADVEVQFDAWKQEKEKLDQMIRMYRDKLDKLKEVRKELRRMRPDLQDLEDNDDLEEPSQTYIDGLPVSKEEMSPEIAPALPYNKDVARALIGEEDVSGDLSFKTDSVSNGETQEEPLPAGEVPIMEKYDGDAMCDCSGSDREPDTETDLEEYGGPDHGTHSKAETQEKVDRRERRKQRKKMKAERKQRKNLRKYGEDATRDCGSKMMKCFTHDNDHWKTAPLWNSTLTSKSQGRERFKVKAKVKGARKDPTCHKEGLECTRMDNEHWKVAPKWKMGPFCFCPNSNNNTYWCIRTINDTHNFLYCEFITGFISFYDMTSDPYQLRNGVHDLSFAVLGQLHGTLEKLRACKGSRECNVRYRPSDDWRSRRRSAGWGTIENETVDTEDANRWPITRGTRGG